MYFVEEREGNMINIDINYPALQIFLMINKYIYSKNIESEVCENDK